MECKVLACLCAFIVCVSGESIDVQLDSAWKVNVGWIVTCRWKLDPSDTLQSVRLYDNDRQFMIYRPETNGLSRTEVYHRTRDMMSVECTEESGRGVEGTCVLTVSANEPFIKDMIFSCEVSGERPRFMIHKETLRVQALVPPTETEIKLESRNEDSGRVVLNCSSSGLPAPQLTWQIGEQKLPSDFTNTVWNATSKLWHTWSLLSYTNSDEHSAVCLPEISKDGKITLGVPVTYNSAGTIKDLTNIMFATLIPILLLR